MVNKRYTLIYVLLALVPLIYLGMVFGDAPDTIPTHFNAEGIADGFGSKWTLLIMPIAVAVVAIAALFAPFLTKFAKQKEDKSLNMVAKFCIVVLVMLDLASISVIYASLHYAEGQPSELGNYMMYLINAFFLVAGFFLPKIKRNSMFGIRTNFTLMDGVVWDKTHALGGKLWVVAGVVGLALTFITKGNIWAGVLPVLVASVLTFIYSAIVFYSRK